VLLSAIFALITTLAYVVFPQVAIGYTISLVFTLFNGLGQVGVNKNNVTDYLQTNSQYLLKSQEEVLQLI
jgi:hypothetical protein